MKHVLVVDDEPALSKTFGLLLGKAGYNVSSASNAQEAIAVLEGGPVDVVLTDVFLPGDRSGLSLLEEVHQRWPDARVIVITGEPTTDGEEEARELGAIEYLSKPVAPGTLLDVVASACDEP